MIRKQESNALNNTEIHRYTKKKRIKDEKNKKRRIDSNSLQGTD